MRRLWILLPLILTACASLPPPGKAEVYLYRRAVPLAQSQDTGITVYDGSTKLGTLQDGSYLHDYVDPGPRAFRATAVSRNTIPYATTLKAGQTCYLLVYSLGDQASGDIAITPVDQDTAQAQLASLMPAD